MTLTEILNPFLIVQMVNKNRSLIYHLTKRQIAARYRGSALGYLWALSYPLMMLTVYTFVFGVVFKARWGADLNNTPSFAVIMFCGMAVFNLFSETVNSSAPCIINNANFVKKVIFPLEILPVVQLLATALPGMIWFGLTLLGALAIGLEVSWTVVLFPLVLVPVLILSLGIGYFVASTTVYLRDVPHLTGIVTQILFFMTPIFYRVDMVPDHMRIVLLCNPLTPLVDHARDLLLFGRLPNWQLSALLWLVSWCICHLGLIWFLKTKKGFADVL